MLKFNPIPTRAGEELAAQSAYQRKLPAAKMAIQIEQQRHLHKLVKGWTWTVDGVSQGFIHAFINNRAACELQYKELWTPKAPPIYREFGSCFQWILTEAYKTQKIYDRAGINILLKLYHKQWLGENPVASQKYFEQQQFVEAMADIVFRQYQKRWNGDFQLGQKYVLGNPTIRPVKWLRLEGIFKFPFKVSAEIGDVLLRGSFDGVFEDAKHKLWLLETKCLSMIDEEGIQDLLPFDIQVMFYLLAIWRVFGKRPAGVLYNVVRRPGLRQGVKEAMPAFLKRIEKDVTDPKRQSHYFKRWQMDIAAEEIVEWEQEFLVPILKEIRLWDKGELATYLNPDQLITKYGHCDMFLPLVKREFRQHFQRKHVYNELVEAI